MYCPPSKRNELPSSVAAVETASAYVPLGPSENFATERRAARFLIPALAPCSLNFTGIVLPRLNSELSSGLMGCRKNVPLLGAWYWTQTTNGAVVVLPCLSDALHVTVVLPGGNNV